MRIVEPRPPRHRAAVRARPRHEVVAVTHECDYPPAALEAAERVTRDVLPGGLSAGEIDAAVRERTLRGEVDLRARRDALARARARPDRHPGAVPGVRRLLRRGRSGSPRELPSRPRVIALDPHDPRRERSPTCARSARRPGRRDEGVELVRALGRAHRPRAARRARPAAPARGGARVARPGLRGGPLDPAADRARRRRGRARAARRALADRLLGGRSPPPSRRSWS